MSFHVLVILQTNFIKYMLLKPMIHGRIGKWILALIEFSLQYVPTKAIKGQVLVDFLTKHLGVEIYEEMVDFVGLKP